MMTVKTVIARPHFPVFVCLHIVSPFLLLLKRKEEGSQFFLSTSAGILFGFRCVTHLYFCSCLLQASRVETPAGGRTNAGALLVHQGQERRSRQDRKESRARPGE